MIRIYLLRHGETTWNADNNRYCGRTDIELTAKGRQQAEEVQRQVAGISFKGVFASPLKRAHITAEIVSGQPVVTDERLIEVDFGTWEAKTRQEFIHEDPILWENWSNDPGSNAAGGTGETGSAVVRRVDDFFRDLVQQYDEGNFLVVAHNGVNRLYMAYKLGMPLKNYRQLVQLNSAVSMFSLDKEGVLTLEYLNSKL